jgi:hypothetical protein
MAPKQIFKFIDAAHIYLDSCSRGKAETSWKPKLEGLGPMTREFKCWLHAETK